MLSTDKAWKKWGSQDPYFGVLADDRFATDRIDAHRDLFFASGEETVAGILAGFEARFGPLARGRALDHGCGVGRLTLPLAARFEQVVAADVAPSMLAQAAANARASSVDNITMVEADDILSRVTGEFDFVVSLMVLQHVPVPRGLRIFDRLVDCVARGGGFHLHLSVRTDRGPLRWLYWASANVPGVKIIQNILAGRRWNAPAMQMNDYPLGAIVAALAAKGITDLALTCEHHGRFVTCGLTGRRPAVEQ